MPELTHRPTLKAQTRAVFARLHDGDGVIVDTVTAFYYGLNRTASFLWDELEGKQEVNERDLVAALCQRFDVSAELAEKDVATFLTQLERYGLVGRATVTSE